VRAGAVAVALLLATPATGGAQQEFPPNGLLFFADFGAPRSRVFISLQSSRGAIRSFSVRIGRGAGVAVPPGSRGKVVGRMIVLRQASPGPSPQRVDPYSLAMPRHPSGSRIQLVRRHAPRVVFRPRAARGKPPHNVLSVYRLPSRTSEVDIVLEQAGAGMFFSLPGCPTDVVVSAVVARAGAEAGTATMQAHC
jgi:hypothetical protein